MKKYIPPTSGHDILIPIALIGIVLILIFYLSSAFSAAARNLHWKHWRADPENYRLVHSNDGKWSHEVKEFGLFWRKYAMDYETREDAKESMERHFQFWTNLIKVDRKWTPEK